MRSPFRKKSGSAEIEAELVKLRQKLVENENKRSAALQTLAKAHAARRAVLSEEDAVVDQATATVRKAQLEADDLGKLVAEYENAIADAEERFRQTASAERTQSIAEQLETLAAKMDAAAPALEKAASTLASVVSQMMEAMPTEFVSYPTYSSRRPVDRPEGNADYASVRETMSALVVESLFNAIPFIFDHYRDSDGGYRVALFRLMTPSEAQPSFTGDTHDYRALPPAAAIAALVSDRARERARQIRAGEIEPLLNDVRPVEKEVEKPVIAKAEDATPPAYVPKSVVFSSRM